MSDRPRWRQALPWLVLGLFSALWLARWHAFPLILDPYYHLFIAEQIVDAGGPITYEWWEASPLGRPHLYPPLLHLLLAGLLQLGVGSLSAVRLVSVVLLPVLLLSLWLVTRRLFSPTIADACLLAACLPYAFHLHSAITMAATLGMIELLWLIDALERRRRLAAVLLTALLCYTHLALPWIALVSIVVACSWRRVPAAMVASVAAGFALALPWLIHVWRHHAALLVVPRNENTMVELPVLLYVAAVGGIWRCWRRKGRLSWALALGFGFLLLAARHRYRWLSGEGMLPVILLAGVGLEGVSRWLAGAWRARSRIDRSKAPPRELLVLLGAAGLLALSPTFAQTERGWRWFWPDAAPWHLLGAPWAAQKPIDVSRYSPLIDEVVGIVSRESRPDEILWSNADYALGMVAALAHRPMSSTMLSEVVPARPFDALAAAHLVIWFKYEPLPRFAGAWQRVAETDVVVVLRQEGSMRRARVPQAVIPFALAAAVACAAVVLIVQDLRFDSTSGVVKDARRSSHDPV